MASRRFGWSDFFQRWLFAFILVAATYNPTGYAYVQWVFTDLSLFSAVKAVSGVALIISWTVYLRATWRSLGPIGIGLVGALLASLIWLLIDFGLVETNSLTTLVWIGIFTASFAMGIGMSWSHIRRKLSGQVDADDIDE